MPSKRIRGESGHSRLKAALILRDALAEDLGLSLAVAMNQLRGVEEAVGAQSGLQEGKYRDALVSICTRDALYLGRLDEDVAAATSLVNFAPRYAQYLALIFFAHWKHARTDEMAFVERLNSYLSCAGAGDSISAFTADDLQTVAFWMATAAGKTHVLHACLAMLQDATSWDRVLVITPSEALTRQHAERLRRLSSWQVFAYPMDGDAASIGYLAPSAIIVLDINKLASEKKGDGLTIPTSVFCGARNLVFVDEGHKGQQSEAGTWKALQNDIAGVGALGSNNRGLLIEFSATFGQVAEREHAFERYAKSILFDYAYDRFHQDGYGKDFWFTRLDGGTLGSAAAERQTLTAALLSFWFQIASFTAAQESRPVPGLALQEPLWVLLGLSVIGGRSSGDKEQTSDVIAVLRFFSEIVSRPQALAEYLKVLLEADPSSSALRGDVLAAAQSIGFDLSNRILSDCFGWEAGDKFVLKTIDSADGELGLGLLRGERSFYFGVVNVGDVSGLKTALRDSGLAVGSDVLTASLFSSLDLEASPIRVLIGSRRFAEGWDNYRASSLTLLRLGQNEGSLIIQMFGRVVRFAGTSDDGKRLLHPPPAVAPLQTAYVYALKSDYLEIFLRTLSENGAAVPVRIECAVHVHDVAGLNSIRAVTPRLEEFRCSLAGNGWLSSINKVRVSLSIAVSTSALRDGAVIPSQGKFSYDVTTEFRKWLALIDFDLLYRELASWRASRGWWNLTFEQSAVEEALSSGRYEIYGTPHTFDESIRHSRTRLNGVALVLVRRMFEGAYRRAESKMSRYSIVNAQSGVPKMYYKEESRGQ